MHVFISLDLPKDFLGKDSSLHKDHLSHYWNSSKVTFHIFYILISYLSSVSFSYFLSSSNMKRRRLNSCIACISSSAMIYIKVAQG